MTTKSKADFRNIAMALRLRRVSLRMSQRALADKIGVSYPHICNIENGRADPTIGMANKIAAALGMVIVAKERDL